MPLFPHRPEIAFGVAAVDVLTGFTGRVTGICRYLHGVDQVLLEPMTPATPGGPASLTTPPAEHWVALQRVQLRPSVPPLAMPLPGPFPPYLAAEGVHTPPITGTPGGPTPPWPGR